MAGKARAKGIKAKLKEKIQALPKHDKGSSRGKESQPPWSDDLGHSLTQAGLRIRTVGADGNCFFRSCCDQMQGNELDHMDLRIEVVEFMREHPDDFSPYMEDEEDFASYCNRMSKEGQWAGMHEQVALTRLKGVALCIHQAGQPCWTVRPDFPEIPKEARALHLSYHDGEHYNSVRLADDYSDGAALPIVMSDGKGIAQAKKASASKWEQQQIDSVRWGTGCDDSARICAALDNAGGNTDLAIEALIEAVAREAAGQHSSENAAIATKTDLNVKYEGPVENIAALNNSEGNIDALPQQLLMVNPGISIPAGDFRADPEGEQLEMGKSAKPLKERQPAKRRACVCGSGKKYKNCCGAAKSAAERRRKAEKDMAANAHASIAVPISNLYI